MIGPLYIISRKIFLSNHAMWYSLHALILSIFLPGRPDESIEYQKQKKYVMFFFSKIFILMLLFQILKLLTFELPYRKAKVINQ